MTDPSVVSPLVVGRPETKRSNLHHRVCVSFPPHLVNRLLITVGFLFFVFLKRLFVSLKLFSPPA